MPSDWFESNGWSASIVLGIPVKADAMLPHCHSRHDLPGEDQWFACSHPQVFAPARRVSAGLCLICPYSSQPPPEQPVDGETLKRAARPTLCLFLGNQIGERVCASCRVSVRWKVFRCVHPGHAETTLKECEGCGDYQAIPGNEAGRDEFHDEEVANERNAVSVVSEIKVTQFFNQ